MNEQASLKEQVISASKWSLLAESAHKLIAPLIVVVLARWLPPEDFGVVAACTLLISFSQILWDAGLRMALIQKETEAAEAAHVVFWTNLFLSSAVYVILFFSANELARLFGAPEASTLLRVLGLQIVLGALGSVHSALLKRDLDFRSLFWVRFTSTTAPGLLSIPLALAGLGPWALVAGALLGSVLQVVTLWRMSSWRPRLRYDPAVAKPLLSFGLWATAENLLDWLILWSDSLVVGAVLGTRDLGLYRNGSVLAQSTFALLLSPLLPLLFSAFSRLQRNPMELKNAVLRATKWISMIVLPGGVGFFFLGDALGSTLFEDRWEGIGNTIAILGLTHGLSWLMAANADAYRALGRPDINTKVMLLVCALILPTYLFAAPRGLDVFLWARLGVAALVLPVHGWVAQRSLGLPMTTFAWQMRWSFLGSGLMAAALWTAGRFLADEPAWLRLSALAGIGLAVYTIALWPERQWLRELIASASKTPRECREPS